MTAVTVTSDVIGVPEFVMNDFSPLITHSSVARVERRLGAGATGIAPGIGLGQAEPTERTTGAQIGQPPLALLLGAELEDRVGAEADTGLERDGERLIDAGDLLDRHAQRS